MSIFKLFFKINFFKRKINDEVIIVSVDLQEMAPIEGINIFQGDITNEETAKKIIEYFKGEKANLGKVYF